MLKKGNQYSIAKDRRQGQKWLCFSYFSKNEVFVVAPSNVTCRKSDFSISLRNTRLQIEINRQWETFFTF
jgi:hypothetical protein